MNDLTMWRKDRKQESAELEWRDLVLGFEDCCQWANGSKDHLRGTWMADAFVMMQRIDDLLATFSEQLRAMTLMCVNSSEFICLTSPDIIRYLCDQIQSPARTRYEWLNEAEENAKAMRKAEDWPERMCRWTLAKTALQHALDARP